MGNSHGTSRPFWMHQLVEYILGGALVMIGLQSPTPAVPAAVGGLVMAHAAFTRGPISAFQLIPRRLHRWIDVAVIAIEVIAGVQPWISVESSARMALVGIAAVHGFVWWNSSFADRMTRAEKRAAKAATVAPPPGRASAASDPVDRSTEIGRTAGRVVGKGIRAYKDRRPKQTE